jgi:hypothetical protein
VSQYLVFDTIPLTGPIVPEELDPLRNLAYRWENLTMHGAEGTRPYAPIPDQLVEMITWKVTGRFDPAGTPHADREQGVEENLEYYRALFTAPGDAGTGEHDLELHYAGTVYAGLCQVVNYGQSRTGPESGVIVTQFVIAATELVEGS